MSLDLATLCKEVCDHRRVVRVVVADVKGSAPREVGAAMLVWATGQSGTIGGGELEWQAAAKARKMLSDKGEPSHLDRYPLGPALGQCCGGSVTLFSDAFDEKRLQEIDDKVVFARGSAGGERPFSVERALQRARDRGETPEPQLIDGWMIEPINPARKPLWIYGAGHVGRALISVLAPLPEFVITWVDTGPGRFPENVPTGVTILPAPTPAHAVQLAPQDAQHLVLTYSHVMDLDLCHAILSHGHGGLGLIGSDTKWARFRARLAQLGHELPKIDQINCPIGDRKLGKHPQAIAIGVATALVKDAAKKTRNHRGIPSDGGDADARRAVDT